MAKPGKREHAEVSGRGARRVNDRRPKSPNGVTIFASPILAIIFVGRQATSANLRP